MNVVSMSVVMKLRSRQALSTPGFLCFCFCFFLNIFYKYYAFSGTLINVLNYFSDTLIISSVVNVACVERNELLPQSFILQVQTIKGSNRPIFADKTRLTYNVSCDVHGITVDLVPLRPDVADDKVPSA